MFATDTTLDALLRAVIERPEDDLPRLVYADALEDRGEAADVARAEFIRLSIELDGPFPVTLEDLTAEKYPGHAKALAGIRFSKKWQRCHRLFSDNREEWFRPGTPEFFNGWWQIISEPHGEEKTVPGPRSYVRRGFVREVHCPLAAWCGGECGICRGPFHTGSSGTQEPEGHWNVRHNFVTLPAREDCPTCHGTGRTVGHGPRIVREHPIERVTITDREPEPSRQHSGLFRWYSPETDGVGELPFELYRLLKGIYPDIPPGLTPQPYWPSRDAAMLALSTAALTWARSHRS